uniref:Methyltransferase type 11 domain-containing protein n=1 Tax=Spermophilus dauricus TaxID=99837 RepID=A0A8C9PSC8_SPEDA
MAFTVFILQLAVRILSFPLYLLKFLGLWNQISKKWFPYYMMKFSATYNEQMAGKKQELFSKLQDFVGSGTGTNFKFYPSGCRVTCVDPNPNFEKFLFKSIPENRHLQFERFLVAAGENMHQVADSSVNVVVCTTVLCSVENQEQMLCEVCRVLRPYPNPQGQLAEKGQQDSIGFGIKDRNQLLQKSWEHSHFTSRKLSYESTSAKNSAKTGLLPTICTELNFSSTVSSSSAADWSRLLPAALVL